MIFATKTNEFSNNLTFVINIEIRIAKPGSTKEIEVPISIKVGPRSISHEMQILQAYFLRYINKPGVANSIQVARPAMHEKRVTIAGEPGQLNELTIVGKQTPVGWCSCER